MITKYDKSSDPSCGDINGWIAKIKWQWQTENNADPIADPNCDSSDSPKPDDLVLPVLPPGCRYEVTFRGAQIGRIKVLRQSNGFERIDYSFRWDSSFTCFDYFPQFSQRLGWRIVAGPDRCNIGLYDTNGSNAYTVKYSPNQAIGSAVNYLFRNRVGVPNDYTNISLGDASRVVPFYTNIIPSALTSPMWNYEAVQIKQPGGSYQPPTIIETRKQVYIPPDEVYLFCGSDEPIKIYKSPDPCRNKQFNDGNNNTSEQTIVLTDRERDSFWIVSEYTLSNGTINQILTPPRPSASLSVQFVFCGCGSCEQDCGNCCVDCASVAVDIKEKFGLNNNNDPGSGG